MDVISENLNGFLFGLIGQIYSRADSQLTYQQAHFLIMQQKVLLPVSNV
jgi:hypothetical protein